jgi:hypothetical protein
VVIGIGLGVKVVVGLGGIGDCVAVDVKVGGNGVSDGREVGVDVCVGKGV